MNYIYMKVFANELKLYIYNCNKTEKIKIKESEIILPVSFSIGDKLYYIKRMIGAIIDQYNVELYNIELDNDIGLDIIEAVKVEGLLEELFSCKGVRLWK